MTPVIIAACLAGIAVIVILFRASYVKAPPDRAFIISGLHREPRVLTGRAGFKVPFFERKDELYLGQMTVDIKTEQSVPTSDFINVDVDAVAKIRISPTSAGMLLAAKNFLNKNQNAIAEDLQDSLQGNMREIIGTLSLKAINTDRDSFSDQVMNKAQPDMDKLGIEILSCNIQNVTDKNGLIQDLGADNTARIKKDASIAKAEADRDVAMAQAAAEKDANEARVAADMEIAKRNQELKLRQAELRKQADAAQAEADAAYGIQEQEQARTLNTATVNAAIAQAEREAELKEKQVAVAKQTLDAEVRAKADAERYRREQEAQAALFQRQKDAEAEKYELEKAAEAKKLQADAEMYAATQKAEAIRAVGEAEAEAIRARSLAEAQGIDAKAEAMKKYGDAAIIEIIMQALPDIAKNVAAPLEKVDSITMYGSGNNTQFLEDLVGSLSQVTNGVASGLGIDIRSLIAGAVGGRLAAKSQSIPAAEPQAKDREAVSQVPVEELPAEEPSEDE